MFVGRAAQKKNLDAVLAFPATTFRLVVCGAERSVPDGVCNLGTVDHDRMPEVFAACDFLLHAAVGEGFPVAVQEAMASGLPVALLWDAGYAGSVDQEAVMAVSSLTSSRGSPTSSRGPQSVAPTPGGALGPSPQRTGTGIGQCSSTSTCSRPRWRVALMPATEAAYQPSPRVAVVVPCLNEAPSIAAVVKDFRTVLPDAQIVVVDNGSTDGTAEIARHAGAVVIRETRRGKGFALLAGLRRAAPADIFIMVDGDDTYPAQDATALIAHIQDGADMVIGTRLHVDDAGAFRVGHSIGNRLFIGVVRLLFGIRTKDLFSGYRALTNRLLQHSPVIARGFYFRGRIVHSGICEPVPCR